jgi:hypothetical protein
LSAVAGRKNFVPYCYEDTIGVSYIGKSGTIIQTLGPCYARGKLFLIVEQGITDVKKKPEPKSTT